VSRTRRTLPLFPEETLPPRTPADSQQRPRPVAAAPRAHTPLAGLWLGVHLPGLPLQALGTAVREVSPHGSAVSDGRRVIACDRVATDHGVLPGLSISSALALCPRLTLLAREPGREQQWLRRLATRLGEFSPMVSLEPPDGMVVDIGASISLFGGLAALRGRLGEVFAVLTAESRLALAPTPLAASWLARADAGDVLTPGLLAGRLGELSPAVCRWPPQVGQLLQELGVRSLADCLRLPRAALARRAGTLLLQDMDRALGRRADPRHAWQAPASYHENLELPAETEVLTRLLGGVDWLLERLTDVLRRRDASVEHLLLTLRHAQRPPTRVTLTLSRPGRDLAHLQMLFAQRLEQVTLPAPVTALKLSAPRLELDTPLSAGELFERRLHARSCVDTSQLVERLRARLGNTAVYGLCVVPEHRPEAAWQTVDRPDASPGNAALPASTARRPLWLLTEPAALETSHGRPCYQGPLQLRQGPERIETGWWDGGDIARDYYLARTPAGVQLWIYRERRGECRWWLHGVFG